jgi:hypothetical protein
LRLHIIAPPLNLKGTVISSHVNLHWSPSPDSVLGYHVYKADSLNSVYTRLTTTPVTDTSYIDNAAVSGNYVYIVKAVKKEVNRSGSYFNTSRGILVSNVGTINDIPIDLHPPKVISHVADTAIKESVACSLKFDNVFYDAGVGDVLTYSLYKADKTAMPAGWTFNTTTNTLSGASPKKGAYTFVVKVTDTQLFSAMDTFTVSVGNASVNEISDVNIQTYPNPFTDKIRFEISDNRPGKLMMSIYDAAGKQVLSKQYDKPERNILLDFDLEYLASGVYYYIIISESGTYSGKIVKL